MSLIKSISGIRGTIGGKTGEGLNPLDIVKFTAAYASFIRKSTTKNSNTIVVGRDARISGPMVNDIVVGTLTGMGTSCQIYTQPNEFHYAATSVDMISPTGKAFCAMTDYMGRSVCVAYDGNDCRTFTLGFPFECITSEKKQAVMMKGILNFLCR